jgi:hypothetical protein
MGNLRGSVIGGHIDHPIGNCYNSNLAADIPRAEALEARRAG